MEQQERERSGISHAENQLQPGARLLYRGQSPARRQGAGRLPAAPDTQGRRALHHPGTQGTRGQGTERARTRPGAGEGALQRPCWKRSANTLTSAAAAQRRWPNSTCWPTSANAADTLDLACPDTRLTNAASISRQGRHLVVEHISTSPFIPNDTQLRRRAAHADHHRAEHGRQVDLHATDGTDCIAGAHRLLRPGQSAQPSALSTASFRASVRPTTWPAAVPPSWSR